MSYHETYRLNAPSAVTKQTVPVQLEDIRCIEEEQFRPQVECVLVQKAQSAMQFVMFASVKVKRALDLTFGNIVLLVGEACEHDQLHRRLVGLAVAIAVLEA